ncbi:MAG: DUF3618 domain-containing protein [Mycobacterium sp.]|nr:DUF3618 domain-containing protein [Mycobacterium sp.]
MAEPGSHDEISDIQSDIERTRGQVGETIDALSAKVDKSKEAVKPPLAIVASVSGATVVGIIWWRRRSRRRRRS